MDADGYDAIVETAGPLGPGEARLVRVLAGDWLDCPDPDWDPLTTTKDLAARAKELRARHPGVWLVHRRTPDEQLHVLACDRDGLFRPVRRASEDDPSAYTRHRLSPLAAEA